MRPVHALADGDAVRGPGAPSEEVLIGMYLTFLNDPELDVAGCLAGSDDPAGAEAALAILRARGLIELPGDGRVLVPPPEASFPALAVEMERQVRRMRASAAQLGLVHRRARERLMPPAQPPPQTEATLLSSAAEVRAASVQIIGGAERSILSIRADSRRTRALLDPGLDHDAPNRSSTGRPLVGRTAYDRAILEAEGVLEVLRRRQRAGEEVRLVRAVPLSLLVVDDSSAVLDLTNLDEEGTMSVLLTGGPLVQAVAMLGRRLFDDGQPITDARVTGLAPADLDVLVMLAAGACDAVAARQLGVSVRTVERRVRHLMDHLGTTSRLQTGVVAARRGLV